MDISEQQKNQLLNIARNTIESIFSGKKVSKPNYEEDAILNTKSGVFVTLTIDEKLRGCIGYIISDRPLYDTLSDAAVQAAMNDPRFPSLTKDELDKIKIEISILSEPFPMKNYDEIEIGKHGLILEEAGMRGLLLPQVPIEHNMNREEFLDAICQKSGFHSGLWREKELNIELFTATVFGEK